MVWHHLNLQRQLQIQLKFRGLSAKLHLMNFEKGSVDENIITMQLLVLNYPKIIYDMGNFILEPLTKKRKAERGFICKMTQLQFLKGSDAKMTSTTVFS